MVEGGATEIGASRLYEAGRKRTYFNMGVCVWGGGGQQREVQVAYMRLAERGPYFNIWGGGGGSRLC